MSGIDLRPAVEAGIAADFEDSLGQPFDSEHWNVSDDHRRSITTAVTAAAPLIEAAVREQVAREIESRVPGARLIHGDSESLSYAARIARGLS